MTGNKALIFEGVSDIIGGRNVAANGNGAVQEASLTEMATECLLLVYRETSVYNKEQIKSRDARVHQRLWVQVHQAHDVLQL